MSDTDPKKVDAPAEEFQQEAGSQQAMDAALRSSFVILKVVITVLVVYLLFSNTFTVEDGKEGAVIMRFGVSRTEAKDIFTPGIRFALPYPIEERQEISIAQPVDTSFAWTKYPPRDLMDASQDPDALPRIQASDPRQGYVLTSDRKALHLQANMTYKIDTQSVSTSVPFVFNFYRAPQISPTDPLDNHAEKTMKAVLESAITHAALQRTMKEIMSGRSEGKDDFETLVNDRVFKLIDKYELGVTQVSITIGLGAEGGSEAIPVFARKSYQQLNEQGAQAQSIRSKAQNDVEGLKLTSAQLASITKGLVDENTEMLDSLKSIENDFVSIRQNYPDPEARRRRLKEMYFEKITEIANREGVKIFLVTKGPAGQPTRLRLQINQPPADRKKN